MPANIEMDTGHIDAGISPGHEVINARGQDVQDEEAKDGVGHGQPPALHPGTGPGELGDQPAQRVPALREVDDNQAQEHAGDDDVDRHPGTDAEQEQGHQGHDDCNQQGQMDCPSRAGTTRSAVLTGNNVVVTDG